MSEPVSRPSVGTSQEVFWLGPQGSLVGLSTDTKPTTDAKGNPLTLGLKWRDFDYPNQEYVWDGVRWKPILAPHPTESAAVAAIQQLIRLQLAMLRAVCDAGQLNFGAYVPGELLQRE